MLKLSETPMIQPGSVSFDATHIHLFTPHRYPHSSPVRVVEPLNPTKLLNPNKPYTFGKKRVLRPRHSSDLLKKLKKSSLSLGFREAWGLGFRAAVEPVSFQALLEYWRPYS